MRKKNWTRTQLWEENSMPPSNKKPSLLVNGFCKSSNDSQISSSGLFAPKLPQKVTPQYQDLTVNVSGSAGLESILKTISQHGYFLPVVPDTQYISVGGAIAHDVHGKNFCSQGSFGHHVLEITLELSTGEEVVCSAENQPDLFYSTIGGLGLTGHIKNARLAIAKQSAWHGIKNFGFNDFEEYLHLSKKLQNSERYQTAWLECPQLNRFKGVLYTSIPVDIQPDKSIEWPTLKTLPEVTSLLSPLLRNRLVSAMNSLKYKKDTDPYMKGILPFHKTLFPKDTFSNWNIVYGTKGFFQFQSLTDEKLFPSHLQEIKKLLKKHNSFSCISTCRRFTQKKGLGVLSFPHPGITLCLDIKNEGLKTQRLFQDLNQSALRNEGSLYLAKDSFLNKEQFSQMIPEKALEIFLKNKDPRFSSRLWERVYG